MFEGDYFSGNANDNFQRVLSAFRQWDIDGNGWIEKSEFQKTLKDSDLGLSHEDIEDLWQQALPSCTDHATSVGQAPELDFDVFLIFSSSELEG